ncbi:hypothetical protein [Candidatus Halobonum tyrrellensis]|nr:hypothetical protein [Candidatus Halobonum tyrrellensis]
MSFLEEVKDAAARFADEPYVERDDDRVVSPPVDRETVGANA